ncbi:PH-domain-containing protein [Epithele typhae]|uniref:PH-domain-containing protein n=1 Tax=Epithele typhae TaxID=378194 RepID=UPI002007E82C|nr:PH-domain-containing protein [Epithele typhae]KAH9945023.1 PH-domain-containing protein [Epithele typhae]
MTSTRSAPPPTHQEVTRKLSVHSAVKPPTRKPSLPPPGTEYDSDSALSPDVIAPSPAATASMSGGLLGPAMLQPPLTSIAERRSHSGGEESEEDDDDEDGGWRTSDMLGIQRGSHDETVIKAGYLWKKGERRKTWKKRWFVLRPAHLAFYKTNAEYKLLRLLDLSEVHSCTPIVLKKHTNVFGLVSPTRTFYLQAETTPEVWDWVAAINDTRVALISTSTRNSLTQPIPIPTTPTNTTHFHQPSNLSSSPSRSPQTNHQLTSSDSEDASPNPNTPRSFPMSPGLSMGESPSPSKPVLSGYLLKCGSRRHNWHKRWFVLSGEKLVYSRTHMDSKPHRQIALSLVIDALEYRLPPNRSHPSGVASTAQSPPLSATVPDGAEAAGAHTFKVVTTKRTLLLCAPSEEEEIKWLSAIRALIARRSGQGAVPGEPDVSPSPPHGSSMSTSPAGQNTLGTAAGSIQRRRDSIVRRLSLSNGSSPPPPAGSGSGGLGATSAGAGGPAEGQSERQSH